MGLTFDSVTLVSGHLVSGEMIGSFWLDEMLGNTEQLWSDHSKCFMANLSLNNFFQDLLALIVTLK